MQTATETSNAAKSAQSTAEIIEALYELSFWNVAPDDNSDPLSEDAADLLREMSSYRAPGTQDELQDAVGTYACQMALSATTDEQNENLEPDQFEILLSWGGPSVRILGELDRGSVAWQAGRRPVIQHQDWFVPWTESAYVVNTDALLWFCEFFYC
tara:strand:+ start:47 stop:514 length:468 start_codon:yes stop_codon:yes gene_type:complete